MNKISLDVDQKEVVQNNAQYLLVVAGAGAGKTLTIIEKINYLISIKNFKEEDILCISFTNETVNALKNKIYNNYGYNIDVLTFHKLSLNILTSSFNIALEDELEIIINIFLENTIYEYPFLIKLILKYYKIRFKEKNYLIKYQQFQNDVMFSPFVKTILSFIRLFKAHGFESKNFKEFIYKPFKKKDRLMLIVIYAIYLEYERELASRQTIDFDDMIRLAILNVSNCHLKYKYIIIDEYQDTSFLRYKLIKELTNFLNAKLMVVGDDWQSIYRFSGCSLESFLNFSTYFSKSITLNINHTYRNAQSLIDIAGKFIMKNPYQLPKNLIALKNISKPIAIIYYQNIKKDLTTLIEKLINSGSLFILGRNNFDIKRFLDLDVFNLDQNGSITFKDNRPCNIRFLTVHKAKGLESDNVIIINLENALYGFPNQVLNNTLLKYVNPEDEYPYAEERRLFYVAMTRSKNKVYLYTSKSRESIFVKEIRKLLKKFLYYKT